MNVDHLLSTMNRHGVRYLLIGGMNFMLRHQPILTFDVDLWIDDTSENRRHCEGALADLDAEWGATEESWGAVTKLSPDWLGTQEVFCLATPHGAIDIFRKIAGLEVWQASWQQAVPTSTVAGTLYRGLSDEDMLRCQLALSPGEQKQDRIRVLREAIHRGGTSA